VEELETWRRLQATFPELQRPFFAPEYHQILGEVLPEVEVAVLREGDDVVGFFPFQRGNGGVARPVGLRLNDFQGLIAPPGLELDFTAVLRESGLAGWRFDHLVANQQCLAPFHRHCEESLLVDLSQGYDAYLADRREAGANWVSQIPRKTRKLSRELGKMRFVFDCQDPAVLEQVKVWKSQQRERTGTFDVLRLPWITHAFRRMLQTEEPGFRGLVSALFAGQRLVAAHFGVRSHGTLHWWFPGYDITAEKYSPGLILLTEAFRAAADLGIERIDLGKGRERYKSSFMTGSETLAEGFVELRPLRRWLNRAWHSGRVWARESRLKGLIKGSQRMIRRTIGR